MNNLPPLDLDFLSPQIGPCSMRHCENIDFSQHKNLWEEKMRIMNDIRIKKGEIGQLNSEIINLKKKYEENLLSLIDYERKYGSEEKAHQMEFLFRAEKTIECKQQEIQTFESQLNQLRREFSPDVERRMKSEFVLIKQAINVCIHQGNRVDEKIMDIKNQMESQELKRMEAKLLQNENRIHDLQILLHEQKNRENELLSGIQNLNSHEDSPKEVYIDEIKKLNHQLFNLRRIRKRYEREQSSTVSPSPIVSLASCTEKESPLFEITQNNEFLE